jgi:hypothetical protein
VNGGTFTKQSGGIIYGSNGGILKNSTQAGYGVYIYKSSDTSYQRNTTAGTGVILDSSKSGSAGGWE